MGIFLPLVTFCCLTSIALSSAVSNIELATEICKTTTNFAFCQSVVYSDSRASDADRYVLSYIAFGQTYTNASDTKKYIDSELKSMETISRRGRKSEIYDGLQKCKGYYAEAVRALSEALNDLDSESFYGFDKVARHVDGCARACESTFHGYSPMSKKNDSLMKLSNICLAVSKLYSYS